MMSVPVESASPSVGSSSTVGRGASTTSPIAVVWCRQVDNEAESPGYTTVPEEFPGHRETLDVIRIVGNLTVNVADTHDYWDPDPTQPLSYYPNLFLYPAYGGRYTCVGRMFLSTEDRPRLGMKTLVLDTAQLLATGEFGPTILRWHASMGGPRRDGSRPPEVPEPALFPIVGEGFLFHRGSTDPVLLVASEEWEPAMQAILELVRVLPSSLVGLGAILAFPYFLPQAKTDLNEFIEQVPLSLTLMRVGRGEAAGERHAKRLAAWQSSNLTVRDLTDGLPATSAKGKDAVPLVLQYIRDKNDAKLTPISQRVDFVEMPRLKQFLSDPDKQSGKDRRKEMWRIGTAMESAALLLQRARGRHVPVNVETAKRAQEYLQARVPSGSPDGPTESAVISPPPTLARAEPSAPGQHPPWLQRSSENAVPSVRSDRVEVVPVSVSDDPSLYRREAGVGEVALPHRETLAEEPPIAPTAPPVDTAALKQDIQRDLLRFVEERLTAITENAAARSTSAFERKLGEAVEARTAPLVEGMHQANAEAIRSAVADLEARLTAQISEATTTAADLRVDGQGSRRDLGELEARLTTRIDETAAQAAAGRTDASQSLRGLSEVEARLLQKVTEAYDKVTLSQAEAAQSLRTIIERRVTDAAEAQGKAISAMTQQIQQRLAELEQRQGLRTTEQLKQTENRIQESVGPLVQSEVERRLRSELEPKLVEAGARTDEDIRQNLDALRRQVYAEVETAVTELKERAAEADTSLRAGLVAQLDLHLAEANDRESSTREELLTQLKESVTQSANDQAARRLKETRELEAKLSLLIDGRGREALERAQVAASESQAKLTSLLDERLQTVERRMNDETESRITRLQDGQLHGMAELQVRLQSYFEQKLREAQDREREKYIELLARLKGEVETQLPKVIDSPKFDAALRDRVGRSLETLRGESQKIIDQRVYQVEERLKTDLSEGIHRVELLEHQLADRGKELVRLEESIRSDLDELDRRTAVLSDRLVPVVRKTWQRIAELEKANPNSADADLKFNQLRREFNREIRRLEGEVADRTGELRDRTETAIANQGKVWLTLIRQLSQLTEERRAIDEVRGAGLVPTINPMDPEDTEERDPLGEIPDLLPASGGRSPGTGAEPPDPLPLSAPEEEPAQRRRARRNGNR